MPADSSTVDGFLWDLWERCILTARRADRAPADAVAALIRNSQQIIAGAGYGANSDLILSSIYLTIQWDLRQQTDRVFETMLASELEQFFKERMC